MMLRRLLWVLVPAAVAAALAVLVLPPRTMPEKVTLMSALLGLQGGPWWPGPEEGHRRAVESARERLRQDIGAREHGSADLRAAASSRALRSRGEPLVVVRDDDVPDPAARAVLRIAERELSFVPRAGVSGVPVIIALHTRSPVPMTGSMVTATLRDRFQFELGGLRACIVDVVFPHLQTPQGRDRFALPSGIGGGLLGRCALYARFGFPGRGAQRWAGLGPSWSGRWWWWSTDENVFAPHRITPDTLPFGLDWSDVPWAELGCLRGRDAFCQTLVGLAGGARLPRSRWSYYYYYGWGREPTIDRLVADVIVRRGTERFVRFWTSPLPAESALARAYGAPAGAVVRDAISHRLVPGPTAEPGAGRLLVAGGWVLAFGLLATALSWHREMDV